jgi:hypothetical protein
MVDAACDKDGNGGSNGLEGRRRGDGGDRGASAKLAHKPALHARGVSCANAVTDAEARLRFHGREMSFRRLGMTSRVFGRPRVDREGSTRGSANRRWRSKLLRRMPWLSVLRWWHVIVLLVLAAAAATAWPFLFPPPVAKGAIVATVDGATVTEYDVLAEARNSGAPSDANDVAGRKALLSQVIDRRLLVKAARQLGIDRDPVFGATVQRAGEMVGAGYMAQRLAGPRTAASIEDARRYMSANPLSFGERQVLVLDSIIADLSELPEPSLAQADTLADVTATLARAHIAFERGERRLDTATLPPAAAAKMAHSPLGALFRFPVGDKSLIGALVARQAIVKSPEEQLASARNAAAAAQQQARLRTALAALRRKAKISISADAATR